MHINVAQLLKEPVGSKRAYLVDEFIGNKGENQIQGKITLTHTDRSILVQGTLTASVNDYCSRCLEPVNLSVTFNMEDQYLPSVDVVSGAHLTVASDTFSINENHILDLEEAFKQYIVTAMPMKILCKTECSGLCPTCGQNLNNNKCSCLSPEIDPHWSKLVKQGKRKEN